MTNFEYYITHVFPTGWNTIVSAFRIWKDLMTDNFEGYALLKTDDPFTECYEWFWVTLGEDDVYPKEFLEYLHQLVDDIDSGKEEVIPIDEDFMNRIKNLVGDLIDD
jgi:hypothetical protein